MLFKPQFVKRLIRLPIMWLRLCCGFKRLRTAILFIRMSYVSRSARSSYRRKLPAALNEFTVAVSAVFVVIYLKLFV